MIATINDGHSKNCANIFISNDTDDGLIATTNDAGNLIDCDEDAAGELIDAIYNVNLMDFSDMTV